MSSFQTSAESHRRYRVSSLSNVSDLYITLNIKINSKGDATISKTDKPAKPGHTHYVNFVGFKPKATKPDVAVTFELPENTEDRKLYVFDIDLMHSPSTNLDSTRTGGWVYIYARSVKYLK
ncbi:MAG: hypothetical protein JXR19_09415 [Bacteroidia bacterium]